MTAPLTINDLKYKWMKTHAPAGLITDTVDDLEFAYLGSLGFTGTLDDRRMQKWPTGEYSYLKTLVGTQGKNETLNDLRFIYYAGP